MSTTTVRLPKVGDEITFGDLPGETYHITHIHGSDVFEDGWGYIVVGQQVGAAAGLTTTLLESEHGTPTGWEYVR